MLPCDASHGTINTHVPNILNGGVVYLKYHVRQRGCFLIGTPRSNKVEVVKQTKDGGWNFCCCLLLFFILFCFFFVRVIYYVWNISFLVPFLLLFLFLSLLLLTLHINLNHHISHVPFFRCTTNTIKPIQIQHHIIVTSGRGNTY